MDQRTIQILFALLRSAICGTKLTEVERKSYSPDLLQNLLKISSKHDVVHLLVLGLKQNELITKENTEIEKYILKAVYRYERIRYEYDNLCEALEKAQIAFLPLKGSVIRNYYPEAWMRTSCDIDILIHKSDIELVENVLCSNKYVRLADSSTHDYNFMSPNKIHIEIHHTLTQDGKVSLSDELLASVWDSNVVLADNCIYRYNMTPELFVIYHLAHMGRHLLHGGCGVRPFIDLWLLEKNFPTEKSKLDGLLIQCNLKALYDVSTELSKIWLEGHEHSKVTERFEQYILCGGTYGTSTNAAKVKAASGIGKVRSFFNLMFLPKENLEVLYPNLKKYPILYPFYQIKRWFGYFDKNKRMKVKHLTEQRNIVTAGETNETADLLKQLGLI